MVETGQRKPGIGKERLVWIMLPASADRAILNAARAAGFDPNVSAFEISSLGRYLLSPKNIEVRRRLIGCEVVFKPSWWTRLRNTATGGLPGVFRDRFDERSTEVELVLSPFSPRIPHLRDRRLRAHILKIYAGLKKNDPVLKRLDALPLNQVERIIGLCADQAGNRSRMEIEGSVDEQVAYVAQHLLQEVAVILDSAHLGRGLFEMGGFNFQTYDPGRRHVLLVGERKGRRQACVLLGETEVDYWIQDIKLIDYMYLLEHALESNARFRGPFQACARGEAVPLKLLFNRDLDIHYTGSHPPEAYREVLHTQVNNPALLELVFDAINRMQLGVSLNYVPVVGPNQEQMFTNITVMHDMRALETIKEQLPGLYATMAARASATDVGAYYVLDAIEGSRHDL